MSEELDRNNFFTQLLGLSRQLFLSLMTDGAIVVIPHSHSLPSPPFSDEFISRHILKPSPFCRGEYSSQFYLEREDNSEIWSLNGSQKTICRSFTPDSRMYNINPANDGGIIANIQYVETAYLRKIKYFVYVVDRCLTQSSLSPYQGGRLKQISISESNLNEMSQSELEEVIANQPKGPEVLHILKKELQRLKSTYVVLPMFLHDAQSRIVAAQKKIAAVNPGAAENRTLEIALNCVIHEEMNHVLMKAVLDSVHADILVFRQNAQEMLHTTVECSWRRSNQNLDLRGATNPLAMISRLREILVELCENKVRPRNDVGPTHPDSESLASDDIIPLMIDRLLTDDGTILSILSYLFHFGKPSLHYNDSFEFTLATYRAASQYILDCQGSNLTHHGEMEMNSTLSDERIIHIEEVVTPDLSPSQLLHMVVSEFQTHHPFPHQPHQGVIIDQYKLLQTLR